MSIRSKVSKEENTKFTKFFKVWQTPTPRVFILGPVPSKLVTSSYIWKGGGSILVTSLTDRLIWGGCPEDNIRRQNKKQLSLSTTDQEIAAACFTFGSPVPNGNYNSVVPSQGKRVHN